MSSGILWMVRKEVRSSPLVWTVPIMLFMGGWMVFTADYHAVQIPSRASAALMSSVQLMGPLAAGVAALWAMRPRRGNYEYLLELSTRERSQAVLTQGLSLVSVLACPYLILTLAEVIRGFTRPGIRGLQWDGIAVGLVGMIALILIGIVVGQLIPRRLTPALLTIVLYTIGVVAQDLSWRLFSPVQVHTMSAFWDWTPGLLITQCAWLSAVSLILIGLASLRLEASRRAAILLLVGVAVAIPSGIHLGSMHGRTLRPGNAAFQYVCQEEVCVHPGYADLIGAVHTAFGPLVTRMKATPEPISALEQRPRGVGGEPSPGRTAFHLDDPTASWQSRSVGEVVGGLMDLDACVKAEGDGFGYSQLVSYWLASGGTPSPPTVADGGSDLGEIAKKFYAASEDGRIRWFGSHYAQFVHCSLTAVDFTSVGAS